MNMFIVITFSSLAYLITLVISVTVITETTYENDIKIRIDAGSRTCFFEKGRAGQLLEVQYQVIDGQHGDYDISFDIIDPNGVKLISDYKKSQNSIIFDLAADGDYEFCMDNSHSILNSKLLFLYVLIEDKEEDGRQEIEVSVHDGEESEEEAVLEWAGITPEGEEYFVEVGYIVQSLTRTLKRVVKARHLLDMHGASKSRDSYLAYEGTFIVDMWSGFQITCMCFVGMVQVYMIKKLFHNPIHIKGYYFK